MSGYLFLTSLRQQMLHPWQTGLALLGIALGVAVVLAVDLANQSASRSFEYSMDQLLGKASHQILPNAGQIPETLYVELRLDHKLRAIAPVIEGHLELMGETFTLLGIDPFAEAPFRSLAADLPDDTLRRLLTEPGSLLLARISAQRLGLTTGDEIELRVDGRFQRARLIGLLDAENAAAIDGLMVADIASAQELLDRTGRLDRIDLILTPDQARSLAERLPASLLLEPAAAHTAASLQLSSAFRINLSAMSLLALLVGGLLIYNTMTFSVLRRRPLLANLRLIGVTRGELFRLILLETLVLGLAGSLLGLLLGIGLAEGLLRLVTRTINDLYYVLTSRQLLIQPTLLLKAVVLGLGASLIAAVGPALEAARTQPRAVQQRSLIEYRAHRGAHWLLLPGIGLVIAGWQLSRYPSQDLILGFAALFLLIVGYALLVPSSVLLLSRLLFPPCRRLFGVIGGLAVRSIERGLSRSGLAVAALSVAVSATVGMDILITSFRANVADWLQQTLQGDLYVSAPHAVSSRADGLLDPAILQRLQGIPGIAEFSAGRRLEVRTGRGPVALLALSPASRSHRGFPVVGDPLPDLWDGFARGELVLVSEPYAYHQGLAVGDRLQLYSAQGPRTFRIGAVFRDFGSDHGMLVMAGPVFARYWKDENISAIGIFLKPGADLPTVQAAVRTALAGLSQSARVRSNREIRQHSLEIFDRTFTITQVLRLLAVLVAFIGILSALLAMLLEQARERAIVRATGATRAQVLGLVLLQTALMGLMAGLFALPLGAAMGQMLIEVINLRSFGWSLQPQLAPAAFVSALLLALAAALPAGLLPAWRSARIQPATALREP